VTDYPYVVAANPYVPPAPILRVRLFHPLQHDDRLYELDAFLDTGADVTLIPLEAVSVLRLPLADERLPVRGIGGGMTQGFFCRMGIQMGEIHLPMIKVIACTAAAIGMSNQMIVRRDILNQCYVKFDGRRQQFSFEIDRAL
jgi:hypothetical protein